jgi:hypothetical protein
MIGLDMTRDEIKAECCGTSDDPDSELRREALDIAAEWFQANPFAVGGHGKEIEKHTKKAHRYVCATMRQRHTNPEAVGFGFDPASIFVIWQIISTLWGLWSAWCDSE